MRHFLWAVLVPSVLLFVIPLFAYGFSTSALNDWDGALLTSVETEIGNSEDFDETVRSQLLAFYRAVPASAACMNTDPYFDAYREDVGDACSDLRQFGWARRSAMVALLLGLLAMLVAGLCVLAAVVSRRFQYASFLVGWNLLRIVLALQLIAQNALAVWLSFWVPELWFDLGSPYVTLLAGGLSLACLWTVFVVMFRRTPYAVEVDAEVLEPSDAPELWGHVREVCERVHTAAPDHILATVGEHFIVTEAKVRAGDRELAGRSLCVSLSLLRALERSEADALLAHEMAHFLGGDSGHAKKLAPLLDRFRRYLDALTSKGLAWPVFIWMLSYWNVFYDSVLRSRRRSELASDALAAKVTSPVDIARSLVKLGAHFKFQQDIMAELSASDDYPSQQAILRRARMGLSNHASSQRIDLDIESAQTPHLLDAHPPLGTRLANVGVSFTPEAVQTLLRTPPESSWSSAIPHAEAIEARLWKAYEDPFTEAHEQSLAYSYEPSTEAEKEHVENYFPPRTFAGRKAGYEVRMDFAQVCAPEWEGPVAFGDMESASPRETILTGTTYLDVVIDSGGASRSKRSICVSKLADPDEFLAEFDLYYERCKAMKKQREEAASSASAEQPRGGESTVQG